MRQARMPAALRNAYCAPRRFERRSMIIRSTQTVVQHRRLRSPAPTVRQRAVVADAKEERPLRAVAAESRQRHPEGERDLLQEVLALVLVGLVAGSEAAQRGPVLPQQPGKTLGN
jgi:hypothetical protein